MRKITKAVFPVAGLGTRFLGHDLDHVAGAFGAGARLTRVSRDSVQ